MGAIVIIQPIKWRRKLELTVRGGKAGQMEVGHQDFSKDFQISWEISTIICIASSSREQAIPKSILSNYFLPNIDFRASTRWTPGVCSIGSTQR